MFGLAAGGGDGDNVTRLTVSFRESLGPAVPAPLDSFTLCIWYYATSFLDASTLVSYAASDHQDDAIRLSEAATSIQSNIRLENSQTFSYYLLRTVITYVS